MSAGFFDLQSVVGVWLSQKQPVSDTFDADAVILRTESGNFDADATILRTESDTFNADAYILISGTYLFLASAVIKRTEGDTWDADAVIRRIEGDTWDADAVIKNTYPVTFNANAVLKDTIAAQFMADAHIKAAYVTTAGTFSARAWIVADVAPPDPGAEPHVNFAINDSQAPEEPPGKGYWLRYPAPTKRDGNSRPVGAVGLPWIEITIDYCTPEVFHYYYSFISAGELFASVASIQCWDPYKQGGADWDLFTGDGMIIWRPEVGGFHSGYYRNVRILITGIN